MANVSVGKVREVFENMEYGPALESDVNVWDWLKSHRQKFTHFIDGKFTGENSKNGKWFKTKNPATGEMLANILQGSSEDVDIAVKSARQAFPKWQALSAFERGKYLYALARLIQKHARLFAVLETMDNGKPIRETRDIDVPTAIRHFYYHAGWAQILEDEFASYRPYGVVGQIIPWNFPLVMLAWKIAPALAAGNTVVLKPAEQTPLTAMLFAELCIEAGLPAGVVNIVNGDAIAGSAIVKHKDVDKIAFTGSTAVGKLIRQETAGSSKALTLELGGKSPIIVFEDADLDAVVEAVVDGIWFNQGEVCCAISKMLVQEGVADKLRQKLEARINKLRLGNPLDKTIDMGAIVSKEQLENIKSLVKLGIADGAEEVKSNCNLPQEGYFYPPTILFNVEPTNIVAETEIFGPVLSVMSFRTHTEALKLANNSRYGLAASIWSENINLAMELAPKLKVGVVWINSTNFFDAACGFGGYKESGFGREGGKEGMYAYLKPSYIDELKIYDNKIQDFISKEHGFAPATEMVAIDKTPKMFVGGKQVRADNNYSLSVLSPDKKLLGHVGEGGRKDIRNAVEAALKAENWGRAAHHLRAQILYYIAENLEKRKAEFANKIELMTGVSTTKATTEVELSLERLFFYAAWCDKFEGNVHFPPMRTVTVAMKEPIGVMGIICPNNNPLLGMISLVAPAIAMGNRVVLLPSEQHPLSATDFYQILETSDVPAGVVNIITGQHTEISKTLAEHSAVDAIWCFAEDKEISKIVEMASADNLKRTWCNYGLKYDWFDKKQSTGTEFLQHAVEIKNIWIPYGE